MTKKERNILKKWQLHFIYQAIASILHKDEYDAGKGCNDTADGSDDGTHTHELFYDSIS